MPSNFKAISFLIFIFIVILNLFWLPTFNDWKIYSTKGNTPVLSKILSYDHPQIPKIKVKYSQPYVSAPNYILLDSATNTVILQRNSQQKIYPASITKLATALTALNIYSLDEIITISQDYKEGKIMELKVGEKITVKSLVSALLVYSANDAAFNLAYHHPQGVSGFVDQMNLITKKYNLKNTYFTNYDGIHNENHYSTVYDLSQLGRISIKNPIIKEIVKTKDLIVSDINQENIHQLISTNEMLGVVPEIEGLKTGWTPEAGGLFIALINVGGHQLISVVAQSENRFVDTQNLISWAKENIYWENYFNLIN